MDIISTKNLTKGTWMDSTFKIKITGNKNWGEHNLF